MNSNTKTLRYSSAFVVAAFVVSPAVFAADEQTLTELIKTATVDMPITTAPAGFLLGASGENVPRLSSFRAFSTQAGRAFDARGKISNAVSVELAPALAIGRTSWEDITNSPISRIWSRTTISFATKAGGNNQYSQSAVGVQAILYAPAMDAALTKAAEPKCRKIINTLDVSLPEMDPITKKPIPVEISDVRKKLADECQIDIDSVLTKWNQSMIAIGGGRTFAGDGDVGMTKPRDMTAYWITASYGADIGDKSESTESRIGYLLTAHARSSSDAPATATNGTTAFAKERLIGINGRYGNSRFAAIAEYSIANNSAAGIDFNDRKRGVLGLEYKVDKDLYLTLGLAHDTGLDENKRSVLAKIHWGFGKTPMLLPK